jgi:hypothetical protein
LYNCIKPYVSGQATRLAINEKNLRQYFVPNNQNWIITTNHDNAIALEDDDRRFWVHRVLLDGPPSDEYFAKLHSWFKSGGTESVFGWLRTRDICDFYPMALPPMTTAKKRMLEQSQPAPVRWLRGLFADGGTFASRTVVTVAEFVKAARDWDADAPSGVNDKNVIAVLKAEGFKPAHRPVRIGADTWQLWARGPSGALDQNETRERYLAEARAGEAPAGEQKDKEAA